MADLLSRVKEHAPAASWLTQESATTACLALSTQYEVRHLLVGALFSSRVASSLTANFAELAVSDQGILELAKSKKAPPGLNNVLQQKSNASWITKIEKALRCTLEEPAPKENWKRATTKAWCLFFLHHQNTVSLTSSLLGGFVGADGRRLEEISAEAADDCDPFALADVLASIV